jgi:hypothetical protein
VTAKPRTTSNTKTTSVGQWKKKNQVPPLLLPSGCVMKIRKIGLQALMQMGVLPNSLLGFAQKAVAQGEGKGAEGLSDQELMELVGNPEQVAEIGRFMDKMMCLVAAEPEVHPAPAAGVERDDELLYVDEIDDEDKMFIFQVVTGGTTDIAEFRRETSAAMATVRGREDVALPSE